MRLIDTLAEFGTLEEWLDFLAIPKADRPKEPNRFEALKALGAVLKAHTETPAPDDELLHACRAAVRRGRNRTQGSPTRRKAPDPTVARTFVPIASVLRRSKPAK